MIASAKHSHAFIPSSAHRHPSNASDPSSTPHREKPWTADFGKSEFFNFAQVADGLKAVELDDVISGVSASGNWASQKAL